MFTVLMSIRIYNDTKWDWLILKPFTPTLSRNHDKIISSNISIKIVTRAYKNILFKLMEVYIKRHNIITRTFKHATETYIMQTLFRSCNYFLTQVRLGAKYIHATCLFTSYNMGLCEVHFYFKVSFVLKHKTKL